MSKRINITLPDKTVAVLDRVTTKGSRFIDRAVKQLVATESRSHLRTRLKTEALENADRDLAMSAEWFGLGQAGRPHDLPGGKSKGHKSLPPASRESRCD